MHEDPMFSSDEFYDYIVKKYTLDKTSRRLVYNILEYVNDLGFVDQEDNHRHMYELLNGAFGLTEDEIEMCHFG